MQPKAATRAICAFRTLGAMLGWFSSGVAVRRGLARLRGIGADLGGKDVRFMLDGAMRLLPRLEPGYSQGL